MKYGHYGISKEKQLKELISRVPPILNVDIIILKEDKYLIGKINPKRYGDRGEAYHKKFPVKWLFPGGRVYFEETPEETAMRILKNETPGVKAQLKKLITVTSDRGHDPRANGVTLYYLFEYISGAPRANDQLIEFKWVNKNDVLNMPEGHRMDKYILDELDSAIKSRNTTEDEILVRVNKNNKVIGTVSKKEAHLDPKVYHRGAHILIFNSKGEVLLQQRSYRKSLLPGWWDFHGGHQAYGQTIEQTAMHELSEEVGITTELHLKKISLIHLENQSEFGYLYWGVHDGPYGFDRNEVEQLRAFDPEKILNGNYDKDFQMSFLVKDYLRDLKKVWMNLKNK